MLTATGRVNSECDSFAASPKTVPDFVATKAAPAAGTRLPAARLGGDGRQRMA